MSRLIIWAAWLYERRQCLKMTFSIIVSISMHSANIVVATSYHLVCSMQKLMTCRESDSASSQLRQRELASASPSLIAISSVGITPTAYGMNLLWSTRKFPFISENSSGRTNPFIWKESYIDIQFNKSRVWFTPFRLKHIRHPRWSTLDIACYR